MNGSRYAGRIIHSHLVKCTNNLVLANVDLHWKRTKLKESSKLKCLTILYDEYKTTSNDTFQM